jgi:hypothetical protein
VHPVGCPQPLHSNLAVRSVGLYLRSAAQSGLVTGVLPAVISAARRSLHVVSACFGGSLAPKVSISCFRVLARGKNGSMSATTYRGSGVGFFTFLYFVAGGIVAATHHYWDNVHALKPIVSGVLATALWPLLLVGINLHVH